MYTTLTTSIVHSTCPKYYLFFLWWDHGMENIHRVSLWTEGRSTAREKCYDLKSSISVSWCGNRKRAKRVKTKNQGPLEKLIIFKPESDDSSSTYWRKFIFCFCKVVMEWLFILFTINIAMNFPLVVLEYYVFLKLFNLSNFNETVILVLIYFIYCLPQICLYFVICSVF